MKLNYTILHISDLHKPQKSSYKNLCESLFVDSDHYEKDGIQKPEIIVVSGDLIEGLKIMMQSKLLKRLDRNIVMLLAF